MKQPYLLVGASVAGFFGGILANIAFHGYPQPSADQVVRARSFELTNGAGQTISYWGTDKASHAVLAFGKPGTMNGHPGLGNGELDKQRVAIGFVDDWGVLSFRTADGQERLRLILNEYGKPFFILEDATGPRVSLGIQQHEAPSIDDNDWALTFYPDMGTLGMVSEKTGNETYVRGVFSLKKEKVKYPHQQSR